MLHQVCGLYKCLCVVGCGIFAIFLCGKSTYPHHYPNLYIFAFKCRLIYCSIKINDTNTKLILQNANLVFYTFTF